jgi:hypothetical protein
MITQHDFLGGYQQEVSKGLVLGNLSQCLERPMVGKPRKSKGIDRIAQRRFKIYSNKAPIK